MNTPNDDYNGDYPATTSAAPDALWWIAHAVAAVLFGGTCLALGLIVLSNEYAYIPLSRSGFHHGITLEGPAAVLLGWSLLAACPATIAHVFTPSLNRAKPTAIRITQTFGVVSLLLFIAALARYAAG